MAADSLVHLDKVEDEDQVEDTVEDMKCGQVS